MARAKALPHNVPMADAAKKFTDLNLSDDEIGSLSDDSKKRAFIIVVFLLASLLQDVLEAAQQASIDGLPVADFADLISDVLDARGWTGSAAWHSEVILSTALQVSYALGRLHQQQDQSADYPYWLYVAYDAIDECDDLYGRVFAIDDLTWYPPIHPFCKCTGESLTEEEAFGMGGIDLSELPERGDFVGPSAEYAPDFSDTDPEIAIDAQNTIDGFDPSGIED